jgi:outer membrane protein W
MAVRDEDDLDTFRVGIGARYRFPMNSDFTPYVGAGLNYYALSLKDGSKEDGMPGVSGEAGVMWLVNEYVSIRLGVQAETSLTDGEAQRDGETETRDVSVRAVGLGLGAAFMF